MTQFIVLVSTHNHPMEKEEMVSFGHAAHYSFESGQPCKCLFCHHEVVFWIDVFNNGRVIQLSTSFICVVLEV